MNSHRVNVGMQLVDSGPLYKKHRVKRSSLSRPPVDGLRRVCSRLQKLRDVCPPAVAGSRTVSTVCSKFSLWNRWQQTLRSFPSSAMRDCCHHVHLFVCKQLLLSLLCLFCSFLLLPILLGPVFLCFNVFHSDFCSSISFFLSLLFHLCLFLSHTHTQHVQNDPQHFMIKSCDFHLSQRSFVDALFSRRIHNSSFTKIVNYLQPSLHIC